MKIIDLMFNIFNGGLLMAYLFALIFAVQSFVEYDNLILARMLGNATSAHSMVAVILFVVAIATLFYPMPMNWLRSGVTMMGIMASHELMWNVFYTIKEPLFIIERGTYYLALWGFLAAFIFLWMKFYPIRLRVWLPLLAIWWIWLVAWFLGGFDTTLNPKEVGSATIHYLDMNVNVVEITSWLIFGGVSLYSYLCSQDMNKRRKTDIPPSEPPLK